MSDISVYTILIALGFLLSIVLSLVLIFSENIFIVLIALYIIGTSIYTYVYLRRNEKNDINYNVNKYISLFNISLSGFLLILMIFKYSFRFSTNSDSFSSYRR